MSNGKIACRREESIDGIIAAIKSAEFATTAKASGPTCGGSGALRHPPDNVSQISLRRRNHGVKGGLYLE
jgi:hypothetical protein